MGTMLYGRGVFLNVCYDELNLRQPDLVRDIHREYVRAGAELLETNTFGANPLKLATHGLADETERINAAAAALAREAAGDARGRARRGRPARRPDRAVRRAVAGRGAGACSRDRRGDSSPAAWTASSSRPSATSTSSAPPCTRSASVSDLPIIAQMTVGTDGKTHYGTDPAGVRARAAGAGRGRDRPELLGRAARRARGGREAGARGHTSRSPRSPTPACRARWATARSTWPRPEYMASYARRMVEAGARFVGGCCGTTPDHIRAMVGFVQSVSPAARVRHGHAAAAGAGGGDRARPAGRALPPGRQARRRPVRHHGRDRAAEGRRPGADVRPGAAAQGGRRGCGQRARRPPRAEPHGRAAVRAS